MKVYRLRNHSEGAPASSLLFLRREDAERYKELVLWPYANSGFWPLAAGGELPLDQVDLRAEAVELDACVEESLGLAVMMNAGRLGGVALLPGDCFDPDEWEPCAPEELAHPVRGPLWAQARARLHGLV